MAFGAIAGLLSGAAGKVMGGMKAAGGGFGGGLKSLGGAAKGYYTGADIAGKKGESPEALKQRKKKEGISRGVDTATALGTAAAAIFSKPKKRTAADVYAGRGAARAGGGFKRGQGPTVQSAQAANSQAINLGQSGPNLSDTIRRRQRGGRGSAGGAGGMS